MITGAHSIIFSTAHEADRAFFRDVLALPHVDAGDGWLIFGLPPSEVALHPWNENVVHRFYLICDNAQDFVAEMQRRGIATSPIQEKEWGLLIELSLPGGGTLGVYQPRHRRPRPRWDQS